MLRLQSIRVASRSTASRVLAAAIVSRASVTAFHAAATSARKIQSQRQQQWCHKATRTVTSSTHSDSTNTPVAHQKPSPSPFGTIDDDDDDDSAMVLPTSAHKSAPTAEAIATAATAKVADVANVAARAAETAVSSSLAPSSSVASSVLSVSHQQLVSRIRLMLDRLRVTLLELNISAEDQAVLQQSAAAASSLFLCVVSGEFNAGKSAFINSLLGSETACRTGVLPTTDAIHMLTYGDRAKTTETSINNSGSSSYSAAAVAANTTGDVHAYNTVHTFYLPVPFLKHTTLVDTPGTNAVVSHQHSAITHTFVPRSDLVLFVTSCDRPFSESERQFMTLIAQWRKTVVIIVNKIDTLSSSSSSSGSGSSDQQQILDYVAANAKLVLHDTPLIFPISARQAMAAKLRLAADSNDIEAQQLLLQSGLPAVEQYITNTLNVDSKIRLKLSNPLGIAARMYEKYAVVLAEQQRQLAADVAVLQQLQRGVDTFEADMRSDYQYQLDKIENVFLRQQHNNNKHLAATLQLTVHSVTSMFNAAANTQQYQQSVQEGVLSSVQSYLTTLQQWFDEKVAKTTQTLAAQLTARYAQKRQQQQQQQPSQTQAEQPQPDALQTTATASQPSLLLNLHNSITHIVSESTLSHQADEVGALTRRTALTLTATEVAAAGTSVAAASGLLASVIGGVASTAAVCSGAGAVAVLSLYLVPHLRSTLQQQTNANIQRTQTRLTSLLHQHYHDELELVARRLRYSIRPFEAEVKARQQQLQSVATQLNWLETEIRSMKEEIRIATQTAATPTATAAATTNVAAAPSQCLHCLLCSTLL